MINDIINHVFWVVAADCTVGLVGEVCKLIIIGGQIKQ